MVARLAFTILSALVLSVNGQIDDFTCPDEFEGYYPHLYSCDKYWKCLEGEAELKLCGNGLGFDDVDLHSPQKIVLICTVLIVVTEQN